MQQHPKDVQVMIVKVPCQHVDTMIKTISHQLLSGLIARLVCLFLSDEW